MTARAIVNPRLGALLRHERERSSLSLREVSAQTGIHSSALHMMEQGRIASPDPQKLQAIARVLKCDVGDLYALSGYSVTDKLPTFAPYLRTKYDLPDGAIDELETYFKSLRDRYGFGEVEDDLGI